MTERSNKADQPARSGRRGVSILPWAAVEPSAPEAPGPPPVPRSARRATAVPPSGLIVSGGFTRDAVSASSPWLPATQRSGPPPMTGVQPRVPAHGGDRCIRPLPGTPPPPRPLPGTPPPPRPLPGTPPPPRPLPAPPPPPQRPDRPFVPPGGWVAPAPAPPPTRPSARALPAKAAAPSVAPPSGRAVPTADALRHEWIVTQEREVPRLGWRAGLYAATGGLVNPGLGPAERAHQELTRRIRQPLAGSHQIAVTSIKGGIGKTTVAACLGLMLAAHRGDGVIALDADPDAGTLADRLTGPPSTGVRGLLAALDGIDSLSGFGRHTSLTGRLRVLAGEQDPATGESFSDEEYERICAVLTRFFDIVITDCGTGLVHSAMRGTLRVADRLVVVGAPTVDGASRASKTLDWLLAHGYGELAEEAVLVLCRDRSSHKVDREAIRDHFAQRCRYVVEIPADPHLSAGGVIDPSRLAKATRDAYLELAALVADGFRSR